MPAPFNNPLAWGFLGLFIGSFLNVCIHRLPLEEETVSRPRRSRCPQCRTMLTWRENIPVFSWLLQRGKCRTCGWRIPVRYPLVELLTAGLIYLAAASALPAQPALALVRATVLAALVVATFVDFDWFEIPDEVSIGGIVLAPVASFLVPALHADTWVATLASDPNTIPYPPIDRLGALTGSLAGIAAGFVVLWLIGWLGSKAYGVEAMGFGDVKLLAAGGGFVGPGGALVALSVAAFLGAVVGVFLMVRFFWVSYGRSRTRGRPNAARSLRVARLAARYIPFGPYIALGIGIVLLYWDHVVTFSPFAF